MDQQQQATSSRRGFLGMGLKVLGVTAAAAAAVVSQPKPAEAARRRRRRRRRS